MADSVTFSFRTELEVAERIIAQAAKVPRLPGEQQPSRHEMAKALMVEALEAREKEESK
jgi:hypothetical protein